LSALLEHEARAQMRAWRFLWWAVTIIGHAHYVTGAARAELVQQFTVALSIYKDKPSYKDYFSRNGQNRR